jgi:lambda family phage portal protein
LIGTGITPRWQIDDPDLKKEIQELWAGWTLEADADQVFDFYGLQSLACRSLVVAGEVLTRFRPLTSGGRLSVPLQIQLLEPDHLDETFTGIHSNGNRIRMGIEFNSAGKRAAYHLFKEHPGEYFLDADTVTRIRVPSSEILHVYRPLRPGQKRGGPWFASVITAMHEMSKYCDAEQVRKSGAAMFGGFITCPPGESQNLADLLGHDTDDDGKDPQIIALEPGTYPALPPGYDVKFSEPAEVGGSYEVFIKHQERRIARGMGCLTYEKLTGDLTGVNYSSIRAGNLEFQRFCKQIISNVIVFQFCRPVVNYWLDQAVLSGALNIPDYLINRRKYQRIQWVIDGWPWVDPLKDIQAEKIAIRSGLRSRTESIAERGRDVEAVDREIEADNKRADQAGLVFDSDPRKSEK